MGVGTLFPCEGTFSQGEVRRPLLLLKDIQPLSAIRKTFGLEYEARFDESAMNGHVQA
jgi:hypothetical protein